MTRRTGRGRAAVTANRRTRTSLNWTTCNHRAGTVCDSDGVSGQGGVAVASDEWKQSSRGTPNPSCGNENTL